jgi:Fe-S cluster biogenesis protein NfuA
VAGEFNDGFGKIEKLVARIGALSEGEIRAAAMELLQAVMEFHAAGLDRMMEIASDSGDPGWVIIDEFGRDPLVSSLLLLHGLHPVDLDTRVRNALDRVRPYLQSHGGDVELIAVGESTVRLKLIGSCNGCPSSSLTLKTAIEKSILEAAPDITSIECEGDQHGTSSAVSVSGVA